jgi:hypothetical protein
VKPLALVLVLFAPACLVPKNDSFATPQDAVLTFQSRLARDDVAGELDCFSQRFRQQNGASLQVYATVRDRLLAPLGFFGRFVLRHNSLEDNLEGGSAGEWNVRLVYSIAGHVFEVVAVPESALSFPDPESGATLTAPLLPGSARVVMGEGDEPLLVVEPVQAPAATAQLLLARGPKWVELANGWKLYGLAPLEGKQSVKPLPAAPAAETRTLRVVALRVEKLGESFGAAQLRFELPLGEASGCVRTLPDGTLRIGSPPASGAPATNVERLRWTADAADLR